MSIRSAILLLAVFTVFTGCSKVIKPADKPIYDKTVLSIDLAKAEIAAAEKAPTLKELYGTYSNAKSFLAAAEGLLEKGEYIKAIETANKSVDAAKSIIELPAIVQRLIDETERNLQLAKEVGMDKTAGKIIQEVNNSIMDAQENVKKHKYEAAKSSASRGLAAIKKANKDVEKATGELTKAKTALAEAKDANADKLVPEMYKNIEEAIKTAAASMEKAEFTQAADSAAKAYQLANDAIVKAKEEALKLQKKQENVAAPVSPVRAPVVVPESEPKK
jgi:hypothetical protein